jgi:hypothetical protein
MKIKSRPSAGPSEIRCTQYSVAQIERYQIAMAELGSASFSAFVKLACDRF